MSQPVVAQAPATNTLAYLIFIAGVCSALHVWKLPPALPGLQREIGLSLVESGFLLSLVQMGGMTLGLVVGLMAQRIGLRRCLLIGLGLISIASVCGAVVGSKTALLVFRAIEGCGFLMVIMPAPALIQRLVRPSYLSRMIGVWSCYIPIATVTALLLGSALLSVVNWRVLWWLLSGITIVMLILIWKAVPVDPPPVARAQGRPSSWSMVKTTLTSENVWMAGLIFGFYAGQWIAVIGFLPTIYALAGISGTMAGVLTAIVAGVNAIGTLSAGRLLHRGLRPQDLLVTGCVVMLAMSFVAFGVGASATVQFLAILMFSMIGGLIPTTLFLLAIRLAPSPATVPTSIGWMQQLSALGQFAGPPFVAWVATLFGGWQITWVATGSWALLALLLSIRLGKKNRLKGG